MAGTFNKVRRSLLIGAGAVAGVFTKSSSAGTPSGSASVNKQQYFHPISGKPLAGGMLYTYAVGTATPKPSYQDDAGQIPNPNPVMLDGNGSAPIHLVGSYKMVLKDALGNTIYTADNVSSDLDALLQAQLSRADGASLIGFVQSGVGAIVQRVQDALRERVTPRQFGAQFDGVTDDSPAFNAAILKLALDGGGTLYVGSGTAKIATPILWPSNVSIEGRGCLLKGTGTNTLIKSAALLGGTLIDITGQYGSGAQGAGTNLVLHGRLAGLRLANAACGIRGHRLNYGTTIENVIFDASLANSYITSHCWGLQIRQCLIYCPAIMKDFADWTEVIGNSFEGPGVAAGTTALTFATGGHGGTYSARVVSNGFHHFAKGIEFTCEAADTIIEGNHFEDVKYHVSGGTALVRKIRVQNNWMKANLASSGGVTAISFQSLWDAVLSPNHYSTDGASTFDAHVSVPSSNDFGNRLCLPYSPSSTLDLSMYKVGDANEIVLRGGSNDPAKAQPTIEVVSGSSGYTVEKYKSRYHAVPDQIPYCTVKHNAGTITIDTWIACDPYGTRQLVAVNFLVNGARTYQIAGHIACLAFVPVVNAELQGGGTGLVVTPSHNRGKLRITITGAAAMENITGWVKEV